MSIEKLADGTMELEIKCVPKTAKLSNSAAMPYYCGCRHKNHDESCIFYKRDALIAAIQTAIQILPSYEEHEFVDGEKCDIQFVKDMLQRAINDFKRLDA